ncbi:MAG: hypothetical protein IJS44_01055, partial [Clostridia bacterium]|nr:hypothetical protein [Clostridia bacterium]
MHKKILLSILAIVTLLTTCVVMSVSASADVVEIDTVDRFMEFMNTPEQWGTSSSKVSYKLTEDLDLSTYTGELEQRPIAGNGGSESFFGTFDGNNKTISGVNIHVTDSVSNVGLFGRINASTIKDLTVVGSIQYDGTSDGGHIGGIVGGSVNGTITNCVNRCTVTAPNASFVGGVAGYAAYALKMTNCTNEAAVSGKGYVGGLVANLSTATNCYVKDSTNTGAISGTSAFIGGIVGTVTSGAAITDCVNSGAVSTSVASGNAIIAGIAGSVNDGTVSGCTNNANVSSTRPAIAGIVGSLDAGTVSGCTNNADLTFSSAWVGGIVGLAKSQNSSIGVTISGCTNTGDLTGTTTEFGGIVGYLISVPGAATVSGCVNEANATISGNGNVGGIVGTAELRSAGTTILIEDSINNGTVTSTASHAGGIAGYMSMLASSTGTVTLQACENNGAISGSTQVGGIFGYGNVASSCTSTLTVQTSKNHGAVSSVGTYVGGIGGYFNTSATDSGMLYLYTSLNDADITGKSYVGGILGYAMGRTGRLPVVDSCMNQGDITATIAYVDTNTSADCGGIVGLINSASVTHCLNHGEVISTDNIKNVGGIIGRTAGTCTVTYCFSDGLINSTNTQRGAIIGGIAGTVTRNNNYWLTGVAERIYGTVDNTTVGKLSAAAVATRSTFTGNLLTQDEWVFGSELELAYFHVHTYKWAADGENNYDLVCPACLNTVLEDQSEALVHFSTNCDDSNDGLTEATAVKTWDEAFARLSETGGHIIVDTVFAIDATAAPRNASTGIYTMNLPAHEHMVRITAKLDASGNPMTGIRNNTYTGATINCNGPITFDHITLNCQKILVIAANWNDFTIGDGIYTWGTAFVIAGGNRCSDGVTEARTVHINLKQPKFADTEQFYAKIYLMDRFDVNGISDYTTQNKTIIANLDGICADELYPFTGSAAANGGVMVNCSETLTISGADTSISKICTNTNTSTGAAHIENFTLNITGNVADVGTGNVSSAITLWNVQNATVNVSKATDGRTVPFVASINFSQSTGYKASEAAAVTETVTATYGTHSFVNGKTIQVNEAYTLSKNVTDECTWDTDNADNDITKAETRLYTCACGRAKAGDPNDPDSFVYDSGAFARANTQNKTTKEIMSYLLRIIVRAYVPEDKTVAYYGIAMLPQNTEWTFEDGKNYVVKNEGSIESGTTFMTDIENIPVAN